MSTKAGSPLESFSNKLYIHLLSELRGKKSLGLNEAEHIEACFEVSLKYWNELRQWVRNYTFISTDEEILFFKHIKPHFTSKIEFYMLCYQSKLFRPQNTNEEIGRFWKRELEKMQKHYSDHQTFYTYYHDGETSNDQDWFLRIHNEDEDVYSARIYDEPSTQSTHDYLVSLIIAHGMYTDYVKGRMKVL